MMTDAQVVTKCFLRKLSGCRGLTREVLGYVVEKLDVWYAQE